MQSCGKSRTNYCLLLIDILAIAPYHLAPQKIATLLGSSLHFKNDDENTDNLVLSVDHSVRRSMKERSQNALISVNCRYIEH